MECTPREAQDLLGSKVKDGITGFAGVVVCYTVWMNGCIRLQLQPTDLDKDGKPQDGQVFDIQQVDLIEEAKRPASLSDPTGGDRDDKHAMSRQR